MSARPFKVLLAFQDRATLRHCARLLEGFGHHVSSTASLALAAHRVRAEHPDVIFVGATVSPEAAYEVCRAADEASRKPVFKILLLAEPTPADLVSALEAGIDDFLTAPVDAAELLARLRAAARFLEFERRLSCRSPHEAPGLLTRPAFLLRLQSQLQESPPGGVAVACLVVEPDAYDLVRELYGQPLADNAVQNLVARIQACDVSAVCGRLDAQRFAIAYPVAADQAALRGEQLRTEAEQAALRMGDVEVPWTLSIGIAHCQGNSVNATQLLDQAEKALALAQQSGGNEVASNEDVLQEERRWSELAGGRLFADTVLRNIMVPCPRLLRGGDSLEQADAVLRQTHLPALPVVDEEGKLAGLLSVERPPLRLAADGHRGTVDEAMQKGAVSFDEATALPVLIDYFTQEAPPVVVIVHKGRPTGLVTPASLGTLVEPLTTATFQSSREAPGRTGLLVPHVAL